MSIDADEVRSVSSRGTMRIDAPIIELLEIGELEDRDAMVARWNQYRLDNRDYEARVITVTDLRQQGVTAASALAAVMSGRSKPVKAKRAERVRAAGESLDSQAIDPTKYTLQDVHEEMTTALDDADHELGFDDSTIVFIENLKRKREAKKRITIPGLELPIRNAATAYLEESLKVPWLVQGYVARAGITEIDGRVKEGKTTMVGAMMRSVLTAEEFLGLKTEQVPVLWVTEEGRTTFIPMLARVDVHEQRKLFILYRREVTKLTWLQLLDKLNDDITTLGVGIVIIDTLSKVAGMRGEDEQSSGAAMAVMAPLQALVSSLHIGAIVTRHDRKSGGDVGESGRGSSAFSGDVDIITQISRDKRMGRANYRDIRSLSRWDETPDEMSALWVPGERRFRLDNNATIRAAQEADVTFVSRQFRRPIMSFVSLHPGCSLRSILKDVPGNTDNKRLAIEALAAEGFIRIDIHGQKSGHYAVKAYEEDPSLPYVPSGDPFARPPHMEGEAQA